MSENKETLNQEEMNDQKTSNDQEEKKVTSETDSTQKNENVESTENENKEESNDDVSTSKDEEIQNLKEQVEKEQEKYLRLYAEFENYKRRIQNENEIQKKYQSQSVLSDILPTLDNFERALKIEGDNEAFLSLKKGVEMVYDSLFQALQNNGLERIKTEGEQFDPNFHQAVVQDDNPDFESGAITEELQTGYRLKDRVLRASMVKVNQ
ncbi:nucleotide exchange factor GrpE [Staphylococcus canis]|uniref:Protein GrpE n=1 Tax=Staphylococcus canis TaxID=2724942 RepID=A0ABS0TAI8_9STAP|nr:nucleotide exchange factor GrpE [Staphylococcus canis]MBI5975761.1 nucleotide exchange factor GrpE [Staphylococcus canis]